MRERERESAYGAVCVKRPGEEGIKGGKAGGEKGSARGVSERWTTIWTYAQFERRGKTIVVDI